MEYEIRIENEIVEFYYENNKISDITNSIMESHQGFQKYRIL